MSNYIENGTRRSEKEGEVQIPSLEQAIREYKKKPTNPELLTQFMCAFWQEVGSKIGKEYVVDKFPLTAREIKEKAKGGQMAIFVPDGITRVDLEIMFPEMGHWAVLKRNSAVNAFNNSGWLWIEASVAAPNLNTTQGQLEEKFKKEGKQGQSLRTYIVGGQISKLLTDRYFDEGSSTWSRLLGSYGVGGLFFTSVFRVGSLPVRWSLRPEYRYTDIGGRSEEVIKP